MFDIFKYPAAPPQQQQQQQQASNDTAPKIQLNLDPLLPKMKQVFTQMYTFTNEFEQEKNTLLREFEYRRPDERYVEKFAFVEKRFSDCHRYWLPKSSALCQQQGQTILTDLKNIVQQVNEFKQQAESRKQQQMALLDKHENQLADKKDKFLTKQIHVEHDKIDSIFDHVQKQLHQKYAEPITTTTVSNDMAK